MLVRLGLACYLGIPVANVAITGVANGAVAVVVALDDAVNTAMGVCSLLSSSAAARSDVAARLRRMLGAAVPVGSVTNVTLFAVVGACTAAADGTPGLSVQLSSLIAGLSNASAGAAPLLVAFLSAAANASGLPPGAVSAIATVGYPRAASSPSDGSSGSVAGGSSAVEIAIGVTVAVLTVVALVALAAVVFLRRRNDPTNIAVSTTPGSDLRVGDAVFISGVNPMRSARVVEPCRSSTDPLSTNTQATGSFEANRARRGSVRSVLGDPRSTSSSLGAPLGVQDNPMHGAGSGAVQTVQAV